MREFCPFFVDSYSPNRTAENGLRWKRLPSNRAFSLVPTRNESGREHSATTSRMQCEPGFDFLFFSVSAAKGRIKPDVVLVGDREERDRRGVLHFLVRRKAAYPALSGQGHSGFLQPWRPGGTHSRKCLELKNQLLNGDIHDEHLWLRIKQWLRCAGVWGVRAVNHESIGSRRCAGNRLAASAAPTAAATHQGHAPHQHSQ